MRSESDIASAEDVLKHIPRAYQEELFIQAQRSNVIATLDTGSGKTFIAALLIKWICSLPSSTGKNVVFLVPKVPLVDQHCDFLSVQTNLVIRGYKGAMGVDEWDKPRWQKEFTGADVLVMTAQIFKNILTHAYWDMNKVSLLVFDECHHAINDHPYNVIMRDHHLPSLERPKIFGMTASPIWNPRDPIMSLQILQCNLLSKVMAVRTHVKELDEHSHKPVEIILHYSASTDGVIPYHNPTLWELLNDYKLLGALEPQLDVLRKRRDVALIALGPLGADYFVSMLLKSKLKDLPSQNHEGGCEAAGNAGDDTVKPTHPKETSMPSILLKVTKAFGCYFSSNMVVPLEWLSLKIRALIELLIKYRCDNFQGIIFVEQRHVASILTWLLPCIPELKGWLHCGHLTGHGVSDTNGDITCGMNVKSQREVVRSFKCGELNLLVATAVAEEGLDFPACQLVIRFDRVHNLVGYVQSRGRARQQSSTFVVMMEENDSTALAQFQALQTSEPELKKVYQTYNSADTITDMTEVEGEEQLDPQDSLARETYVIPSTGATLTYNSAISLLDHLCSIIPRDEYTPVHRPVYTDGCKDNAFHSSLRLPSALPLSKQQLLFKGPSKGSKKEAKRAVAFMAIRQLHLSGVFDDHLSPVAATKGDTIQDADGRAVTRVDDVPPLMNVHVVIPWKQGPPWFLHPISLGGQVYGGLLSGAVLPGVALEIGGYNVQIDDRVVYTPQLNDIQLELIDRYMKMSLFWCVTSSPTSSPLACYLVPLIAPAGEIDWMAMERAVANELGTFDWSATERDGERLLLMNSRRYGRPLVLNRLRHDLSLDDRQSFEPEDPDCLTYRDYFHKRYALRINGGVMDSPRPEGPILEVIPLDRRPFSVYRRDPEVTQSDSHTHEATPFVLPQSYCRWIDIQYEMVKTFSVLSPLCQYVQDIFRASCARNALRLPPISDSLTIEAFTTQDAIAGFNNQRLETLGDGVLKLAVVVYLFNRYPHKHEGQLDRIKANSVSNRFLLTRAKAIGLEHYISGENRNVKAWQFIVENDPASVSLGDIPCAQRILPRRNLQDCMEALLGASLLSGGITMAIETGAALGLCFGGSRPWHELYVSTKVAPVPAQYKNLEKSLGYQFRNGELLLEAFTHPSFENSLGTCYQRLEFLGDALVGLVVTDHIYRKFPSANPGQITRARDKVICNSTQAAIAVRKLSLHKYLLANNIELSKAISKEDAILSNFAYADMIVDGWQLDPPKVLGDIFESVIGAVLVDSNFNYDVAAQVVKNMMEDVLDLLHPDVPRDPVSQFYLWVGKTHCQKVRFERVQSNPLIDRRDSIIVHVHGKVVVGPVTAANISLAKGIASERAKAILSDESSELAINRLCDCMDTDVPPPEDDLPPNPSESELTELSDETEEGFSRKAQIKMDEASREGSSTDIYGEADSRQEVETMLCTPSLLSAILDDEI